MRGYLTRFLNPADRNLLTRGKMEPLGETRESQREIAQNMSTSLTDSQCESF